MLCTITYSKINTYLQASLINIPVKVFLYMASMLLLSSVNTNLNYFFSGWNSSLLYSKPLRKCILRKLVTIFKSSPLQCLCQGRPHSLAPSYVVVVILILFMTPPPLIIKTTKCISTTGDTVMQFNGRVWCFF